MKKINLKINLLFIFMVLLCLPAMALAGNATYSYDTYDRIERVAYEKERIRVRSTHLTILGVKETSKIQ